MDTKGTIGPIMHLEHGGLVASNKMCIIINEYFS